MSRFGNLFRGEPAPAPKVEAAPAPKPTPKKVVKLEEPPVKPEVTEEE